MNIARIIPSLVRVLPLIHPLDEFYSRAGRTLPEVEAAEPGSIPQPEKSLLVHDTDMTSTLAAFHGASLRLEVLSLELRGDICLREVVLRLDGSCKPVEFGAIKIHLHALPPGARRLVLEGVLPLGQILRDGRITFGSKPKGFLKITPDAFIRKALELGDAAGPLFGRRNTLSDPKLGPIAEIVEILPGCTAQTDSTKDKACST